MGNLNTISVELNQGSTTLTSESYSFISDFGKYRNGSLISTPCPPGFHPRNSLFACIECDAGYFSSGFDLNPCRKCLNNVDSSRLNFSVNTYIYIYTHTPHFQSIIYRRTLCRQLDNVSSTVTLGTLHQWYMESSNASRT